VFDTRELEPATRKRRTWVSRKPEEGSDRRARLTTEPEERDLFVEQSLEVERHSLWQPACW
jgi:hypothetical protein